MPPSSKGETRVSRAVFCGLGRWGV